MRLKIWFAFVLSGCLSPSTLDEEVNPGAADTFASEDIESAIDRGDSNVSELQLDPDDEAPSDGSAPIAYDAIVRIRYHQPNTNGGVDIGTCTGTAVGRRLIITARHCLQGRSYDRIEIATGESADSTVPAGPYYIPEPVGSSNDIALLSTLADLPSYTSLFFDYTPVYMPRDVRHILTALHWGGGVTRRAEKSFWLKRASNSFLYVGLLPAGASGCPLLRQGRVVGVLRGWDGNRTDPSDRYVRVSRFRSQLCGYAVSNGFSLGGC